MDPVALARLRRTRGYPVFLSAATLSRLADEMFSVAVVLLVLERTGSAALAGATVAAITLPSLVSGPLLGAWFDLTGRRRGIMAADHLLAAGCLVGIVLAAGRAPDLVVPALALVAGLTYPISFGGFTSMVPLLVDEELLTPANALETSSMNVAMVGGPALAGLLAAGFGAEAAVLGEAALTLAALALVLRLPHLPRPPGHEARSLLGVAGAGLRLYVADPILRGVTTVGMTSMVGMGLLTVAFPLWAESLGAERSAGGFLWAAFALGSTLGVLGFARMQDRWPAQRVVIAAVLLLGLVMLGWPLAGSLAAALGLVALGALADGPGLAATFAVRQQRAPRRLYGGVATAGSSLKVGAFALGAGLAGPVVVALGPQGALLVAAGIQFVGVGAGLALMRAGRLAPVPAG